MNHPTYARHAAMRVRRAGPAATPAFAAHDAVRIAASGMVVWNGPVGIYEVPTFSRGTRRLAEAIARATRERGVASIVGGGDTLDFHKRCGLDLSPYSFVSTGGGAMLEFLSGRQFHALEALSL